MIQTQYITMSEEQIDEEGILRAGEIIRAGGLVAFPTETVYGLGGDALNARSSEKIYAAKGRPSDNPLIVHICDFADMEPLVSSIPDAAVRLADAFWPGPLTMILKKSRLVPYETTGGLDTVAIRYPSHKVAQALIHAGGGYIAAPSANRSGRPSPTLARYCREDLDGRVDMIIDGGQVGIGIESTIIDLTEEKPVILRPGYITRERMEMILREVDVDRTILDDACGIKPKAPGMKYRHYAPRGEMELVEGDADSVVHYINSKAALLRGQQVRCGVICTDETAPYYTADSIKSAGTRTDEAGIARQLFRILREFDDENIGMIFSEAFPEGGIGMAIMNRLMKAAGGRTVRADRAD